MNRSGAITQRVLRWLLASQVLVLIPLATRLSWWLIILALSLGFWRWQMARGAWPLPRPVVKIFLVLAVSAGLFLGSHGGFAMTSMLGLLVAGFVLKLLELRRRTDIFLLCYLGYFVVGTQLLFAESILAAAYGLLCLSAFTGTLLVSHRGQATHQIAIAKILASLIAQAIPVMLLLFLLAPRIGALWSVPLQQSQARTGVSDSMAPGDFATLMRSGDLAFRVSFDGAIPPPTKLYWRALVLDKFNGRRWSQSWQQSVERGSASKHGSSSELQFLGDPVSYQVMLEATQKNWLYGLSALKRYPQNQQLSSGFTLYQRHRVTQRTRYTLQSVLDYRMQAAGLTTRQRRAATALPKGFNPVTRARAKKWRAEAGSDSALITRLLHWYRAHFTYTLQPPVLGKNTVDEFLWHTQAGFCEHFAGSFVFFMRAAGIPARVVVGYQGGEVNPEGYLAVRQYDAHAWAEVWLKGLGWQRVDPTAAVAPERIERGVEYSLDSGDTRLLGNALSRRFALLRQLERHWDALNYHWQLWVMSYNSKAQQAFLKRWFGTQAPWQIALWAVLGIAVFLILLFTWSQWRLGGVKTSPAERAYRRFCRKLAKAGCPRASGEAPTDFARRAAPLYPSCARQIADITQLFLRAHYGESTRAIAPLKRTVAQLRLPRKKSQP